MNPVPVAVTPLETTIRLRVQVGTDASGDPILQSRNYDQVKPAATDQEVFDVAQALAGLHRYPTVQIIRVNEAALAAV